MGLEPSDSEVIRDAITSWLEGVHTSMPGSVVSYDAVKQTAYVQPAVQRATPRKSGGWVHSDYPIIPNVKVAWMSAGGVSLQSPLLTGDAVWLLFSETCWAQYRKSGQIAPPGDMRRFDLSFPIALPVKLVGALRAVTGPHFEVPDGQALTVGGDPALCKAVAIAEKVQTELTRIKADLTTLKSATSTGLGGVPTAGAGLASAFSGATSGIPSNPGSTAAEKLKTQ